MKKLIGFLKIAGVALAICAVVVLLGGWRAAKHEPEFYTVAMRAAPESQKVAGKQLEERVVELKSTAQRSGRWETTFTNEQINGWLATSLVESFPDALPKELRDPRVAIDATSVKAACRVEDPRLSTVLNFQAEIRLTENVNEIEIKILRARAGLIPLPWSRWKDEISQAAQDADIVLTWDERDDVLVALAQLPLEHKDLKGKILTLETLELKDGEVYLAGRTDERKLDANDVQQTAAGVDVELR